ncbi:hypothetical protein DACRYDRAFT_107041 [Dacryopinax primogenitus]|uniref:Uncharacterized protein n=1 Tax=Dacryopinax primogenitus (strain DJM 731) TaxID=1858805 RepID=M5G8A6_DACPD|nr:uncharacterized protein DACRYDRAFT_107041 [Dacryopinax primogenitus]EJU02097.1 hypothetical protein DACRYDRAFT_107041 [Dacryopinax primogenitus]
MSTHFPPFSPSSPSLLNHHGSPQAPAQETQASPPAAAPATPPPPCASPPAPPLDNSLSSLNFNPPAPPSPAPLSATTLVSSPCPPSATDTPQPVSVMQTPASGQKRPSEESNMSPSAPKRPKQLPGKHVNNVVDLTKETKKALTLKEKLVAKDQEILAEKAKALASEACIAKLLKLLEQEKNKNKKEDAAMSTLIPKPPGQAGHGHNYNGYNLQKKMGLGEQRELFKSIQKYDLDVQKNITAHPPALLSAIYAYAHEKAPQLAAFEEDWVTCAIIQQFAKNRKYNNCIKKEEIAAEKARLENAWAEGEEGEGEGEEGGGGGGGGGAH